MHLVGHVHPSAGVLNPDLLPVVALVAAAALTRRGRTSLLLLGAATATALVSIGPVHEASTRSVSGHMIQHLVLVLVVAPCLGLVVATAPSRVRASAPLRLASRAVAHPLSPLAAAGLHTAALVVWHLPGPYDGAVHQWALHAVEHLTLVVSGAWWWATVVHHTRRRGAAVATASLFAVATAGATMGVFMMFAPTPLYAQGGVDDQQLAGALMAGTGLVFGAIGLWSGAKAIEGLGAPRPPRIPHSAVAPVVLTLCLGGGVALAVAHSPAAAQATPPEAGPPSGDLELGRDLYRRDCASCHGPDGAGSFRGTPLLEVGTASVAYYLDTGRMPISHPRAAIRRQDPAYPTDQIAALVAYLDSLVEGPEALEPDPAGASVARGGEQYRLHCAACHGAEGIGGALAFQGFAPSVLHSTPSDVANAMLAGPGAMPAFAATFDEDAIADVAAYVTMLQDPPRTGVALPGGRVGEGLVAWVAGLGTIVLVLRWMGVRQ